MSVSSNFKEQVIDIVGSLTKTDKIDYSNLLFKKSVETTDLTKDHTVITGVRHGNYVPIIDNRTNYEAFPFSNPNECAVPECNLETNYSVQKWELGLLECKVPICLRSFDADFMAFYNQYQMVNTDGEKNDEYMQTALVQFLVDKFKKNLLGAQWRTAYFGDTSSDSDLFNGFNGFFAKAQANANNVIEISENQNGTYSTQKLSGERIYQILEEMYQKYYSDSWMSDKPVEFRMTKANAMALTLYFNGLKDKTCCNGLNVINPENVAGAPAFQYERLAFHGIPIKVMPIWDEIIHRTAELNKGFVNGKITNADGQRVNPNRILLTYKENLVIGTQETDNLNFFDMWHSKDNDKIYLKGGSYFGASIPEVENCILAI